MPKRMPTLLFLGIVVPQALVFVLAFLNPGYTFMSDSGEYLRLGHNLWQHLAFSTSDAAPFIPEIHRVPGYPIFLGFWTTLLHLPTFIISAIQCAIAAWTAILLWKWLNTHVPPRAAVIGALVLGWDLVAILHTPIVLAEPVYTLLLFLAMGSTWKALETAQNKDVACAGGWWGLGCILKPVGLYLPIALVPLFYKKPKLIPLFLLTTYLLPLGWLARNYAVTGHLSYTPQSGYDLLVYPATAIEAHVAQTRGWTIRKELTKEIGQAQAEGNQNEFEEGKAYGQKAMQIFKEHPFLLVWLTITGCVKILGGTGIEMIPRLLGQSVPHVTGLSIHISGQGVMQILRLFPALIPIQVGYTFALAAVYLLFLRGLWMLHKKGQTLQALFLLLAASYFLLIASHQAYYRFRIPMIVFLAVGVAFGSDFDKLKR